MGVPLWIPDTIAGKASAGSLDHCEKASRDDSMKPTDSSWGVVCALPTRTRRRSSTINVSVIGTSGLSL
jgi:hypothetical protein